MSKYSKWHHPYAINEAYSERVAYFSMEFAIHQALKIYSGGLGFLAGSHMRSGYDLRQNMIGIGLLWKYGYYDQGRNIDQTLQVQYHEKFYSFLEDTGIIVKVTVHDHPVWVKAMVLKPDIFGSVPLYLLTTDIPENDYLSRTITHKLYDAEQSTRVAQSIVLGIGGAKVVDALGGAAIYHMNEAHSLPMVFELFDKYRDLNEVKKHVVFTTHTPERAGNEEHDINFLNEMTFFGNVPLGTARELTCMNGTIFSHTLAALRMAKIANGVSQLHGEVSRDMWAENEGICQIKAITNAQNVPFWRDEKLHKALELDSNEALVQRKAEMKKPLFEIVADQTGKLFKPDVLTIVWARRFAAYKRPDLLLRNLDKFFQLLHQKELPVQLIIAGKPYPLDYGAIDIFNRLVKISHQYKNFAVLTGYELDLSKKLKRGADVWLNTPRRTREASGTSGMAAAMNGAINFTIQDGWIPEFSRHGENSFLIPIAEPGLSETELDNEDYHNMMEILEEEILPAFYQHRDKWVSIMKQSMRDVVPQFSSDRMASEYYKEMYQVRFS